MMLLAALVATLMSGAMFGFYFAWVTSTMWGLDAADPQVAMAAMQAMNASVRNAVFAPAFFGTGPALVLAAGLAWHRGGGRAALAFGAAALVHVAGSNVLTFAVNVPMNEALAAVGVPNDPAKATVYWEAYSPRWQAWNLLRTVACGAALLLASLGLTVLPRKVPGR